MMKLHSMTTDAMCFDPQIQANDYANSGAHNRSHSDADRHTNNAHEDRKS